MKLLLCLVSTLISVPAFAGKLVGNGGLAVICKDGAKQSAKLLDTYEARKKSASWSFGWNTDAKTVEERLVWTFEQLARYSPKRSEFYKAEAQRFLDTALFIDEEIPFAKDFGKAPLARGCDLKQVAVQVPSPLQPSTRRLLISAKYFYELNVDERAALIVHELLVAEVAQWAEPGQLSEMSNVRPLTALLVSDASPNVSLKAFLKYAYAARLATYEAHGYILSFLDALPKRAFPDMEGDVVRSGNLVYGEEISTLAGEFKAKNFVAFNASGVVTRATLAEASVLRLGRNVLTFPASAAVSFDDAGNLLSVSHSEVLQKESAIRTTTWKLDKTQVSGISINVVLSPRL